MGLCVFVFADALAFAAVRVWRPQDWPVLRRHLLGPLDGFPLVRDEYLLTLGAVLLLDLVILRHRSALLALLRFGQSERVDLALASLRIFGLGLALPALATAGLSSLAPRLLREWRVSASDWLPDLPTFSSAILLIITYTVIVDFLRYWWHRTMHKSTRLWHFHEVHHSATSFTVLTGNRVHPVEDLLSVVLVVVPLVLAGASTAQSLAALTVLRLIDMAQHSMMPFTYGVVGRWLVFSPVGHRIHHSPEAEHWGTNFGDFLPIWDRIFGTWYSGSTVNESVGSANPDVEQRGVVAHLALPFRDALS